MYRYSVPEGQGDGRGADLNADSLLSTAVTLTADCLVEHRLSLLREL